jgi:hypothetical protein
MADIAAIQASTATMAGFADGEGLSGGLAVS